MWGEGEVTQPLGSFPLLGNQRLIKASESCGSYIYVDALFLLSIDVVVYVSEASPFVNIHISIYVFHSIDVSSFRALNPFCTRVGLYMVQQTDARSTVFRGGSRFLFESTSSGEVGELIWRRGSRSFTGTIFPPDSRGLLLG